MNSSIASGWTIAILILVAGIVAHRRVRMRGWFNTATIYGSVVVGMLFTFFSLVAGKTLTCIPMGMTASGVILGGAAFHWVRQDYLNSLTHNLIEDAYQRAEAQGHSLSDDTRLDRFARGLMEDAHRRSSAPREDPPDDRAP